MLQRATAPFGPAPIRFVPAALLVALSLFIVSLPGQTAQAVTSLPSTCQAPLTLHLQPGEHDADGSASGPVAPDIPLDPVLIALPLYPGAQSTTQPVLGGNESSFSPYEKSAAAEYLLPTDPNTATAWYVKAMASCGYPPAGLGQVVGGGATWNTWDFSSPTIPSAQIQLSFATASSSSGGTSMVAYADVLSPPRRPQQSELLKDYRQVTITYRTSGINPPGKHLNIHLTVRQQTWISELVLAVNIPQEILGAPHSCGGRDWNVTLRFYPRSGKAVTVNLQCDDLEVDTYPTLIDPGNQALLTVQKIILASCQAAACKDVA